MKATLLAMAICLAAGVVSAQTGLPLTEKYGSPTPRRPQGSMINQATWPYYIPYRNPYYTPPYAPSYRYRTYPRWGR